MKRQFHLPITCVIAICLLCHFNISAQYFEVPTSLETRVTEPNPEATAMRRYTDVPVSYASGSAEVNIPLLEVSSGELGLSLSLSYNTASRRATDLPGYTGIGWSLCGLGRVSRQVVGLPDEKKGATINVPTPTIDGMTEIYVSKDDANEYISQETDCQYDIYSFDIPGYAGSFIINSSGEVELLPMQDVTITFHRATNTGSSTDGKEIGEITDFTIETLEGLYYTFGAVERVNFINQKDPITSDKNNSQYECPVTWNLTKIQTHDKKQSISIEYDTLGKWTRGDSRKLKSHTISWTQIDQTTSNQHSSLPVSSVGPRTEFTNPLIPKSVTLNNSRIEFEHKSANYPKEKGAGAIISRIKLFNYDNKCVKEVSLNYSSNRHLLPEIYEVNVTADNISVDYKKFLYNGVPEGEMYDAFGVFNGEDQTGAYYSIYDENGMPNQSRASNPTYVGAGVLSSIEDAMGCITSFEYEPKNYIVTDGTTSKTYQIGRRIKTIKAKSPQTDRVRTRTFIYSDSVTTVDLSKIGLEAWCGLSGSITDVNPAGALLSYTKGYSQTASMTSSSRVEGKGLEGTDILYKKVTEEVTGTGITRALRTTYIFDLSDAKDTIRSGAGFCYPSSDKVLGNHSFLPQGSPQSLEQVFTAKPMDYFIQQNYGGAPLLKEKITYEWRNGYYHPYETERHTYRQALKSTILMGLHCESVTFREGTSLRLQPHFSDEYEALCYLYYAQSVQSIPDSVITTRHYPDGNSRTVTAALRYISDYHKVIPSNIGGIHKDLHTYFIPEVPGDTAQAHLTYNLTRPVATVMTCGDQTLSKTDVYAYNIAGSTKLSQYANNGYATLPIKQVWVANSKDTMMVSNEYGLFDNVPRLTRQWLSRGNRTPLQEQRFTEYTQNGFPVSGITADGATVYWLWGDDDCLYQKTTFPGLYYKFEHTHLVGCTKVTTPSGSYHKYSYYAGRLAAVYDCWNNLLHRWSYGLYKDEKSNFVKEEVRSASGMLTTTQLYDAFGLPYLNVSHDGSAPLRHLMTATQYDALDREIASTVPMVSNRNDFSEIQYDYCKREACTQYYDGLPENRFSYPSTFDSNPSHIYKPGGDFEFMPTTRTVICNSKSSTELKCWKFNLTSSGNLERNGYWADGSLEVVRTTDPDGNVVLSFNDWRGLTVLERRKISAGAYADTYFVYDSWGNPLAVLTPEYVQDWTQAYSQEPFAYSTNLKQKAYYYVYDSAGRISEKRIPGCDAEKYYYDSKGRLAFSQDGEQRASGRCMVYFYDQAARLAVKGECLSSVIPTTGAETLDMTVSYMGAGGSLNGYSHKLGRLPGLEILETNYYDHYHFLNLSGMPSLPGFSSTSYSAGLLTGHLEAILHPDAEKNTLGGSQPDASPSIMLTAYQYDYEERVTKQVSSTVSTDVFESVQTLYNIAGQPMSVTTSLLNSDGSEISREKSSMTYDYLGRQVSSSSKLDSNSAVEVSSIGYDRIGRPSTDKTVAGTTNYSYNLNSELMSLSTPCFSQTFSYSPAGLITARSTNMVDGNSFVSKFNYDGMGRLLSVSTNGTVPYTTAASSTPQIARGSMTEATYAYDRNSNITNLTRSRFGNLRNSAASPEGTILPVILSDNLTMTYGGNQVTKVTDDVTAVAEADSFDFNDGADESVEYTYDRCGRMTSDLNRGIDSIEWSITGRPMRIRLANGCRIDYFYSASGAKLREQLWEPQYMAGGGASSLLSQNGAQRIPIGGGGTIVIPIDSIKVNRVIEDHRWIGRFEMEGDSLTRINHAKGYWAGGSFHGYLHDWQGNICAVVNQNGTVEQSTLYYSYGLPFLAVNPEVNPYKFSGKELDMRFGLNMAHHGARLYFPDLGIFLSPDRKCESYGWLSPYLYCAGNPLSFIDPTGMEVDLYRLSRADFRNGLDTTDRIIQDLESQTGLKLSLDENTKLQYAKDDEGKPIVSQYIKNGKIKEKGSKTARKIIIKAINSKDKISVRGGGERSGTNGNEIVMSHKQITDHIQSAVGVNGNTLGFGMTFLHEVQHTDVFGGYKDDRSSDYGTGPVVDYTNKIRRELNKQDFNYGQRMHYKAIVTTDLGPIITFSTNSFWKLKNDKRMNNKDYYIISK
ncbi:MAG: RHS repeat-associated core domain-containing protein [Bacteroides sp.]|nr:RHS repeat-associated core domain-containing protein [Bacteroides sp.]